MDIAKFFHWYVSKKLWEGRSLRVDSITTTFCDFCHTVRNTYNSVGDCVTAAAGMMPIRLNWSEYDFTLSIPHIMVQCDSTIVSLVSGMCPNPSCCRRWDYVWFLLDGGLSMFSSYFSKVTVKEAAVLVFDLGSVDLRAKVIHFQILEMSTYFADQECSFGVLSFWGHLRFARRRLLSSTIPWNFWRGPLHYSLYAWWKIGSLHRQHCQSWPR